MHVFIYIYNAKPDPGVAKEQWKNMPYEMTGTTSMKQKEEASIK